MKSSISTCDMSLSVGSCLHPGSWGRESPWVWVLGLGDGCLVSSVQGPWRGAEPGIWRERQEEETRRGNPIDNRPSTSTGWFFLQPLGQEKVAVMCCKGTCRRWQWCVEKIPAGGDSDVLKIYLVEVTVMCCKDTCRRWQWYAVNLPGGGDSDVM